MFSSLNDINNYTLAAFVLHITGVVWLRSVGLYARGAAYVAKARGLALHVCEGLRVDSVPAQGNSLHWQWHTTGECL